MSEHKFRRIGKMQTTMALNVERKVPGDEMTVVIVGVPRGGTTMVAAVVDALGVDLGPTEELHEYHFEDQTAHTPYLDQQFAYVAKRNAETKVWGWKDPVGLHSLQQILFALRNPHVIVVFRDTLASIQGEMRFDEAHKIDPPRTFESLIEQTQRWWAANWEFITRTQFPTLLVSYERALWHSSFFMCELTAFLGLESTDDQMMEAIKRIGPGYWIVPTGNTETDEAEATPAGEEENNGAEASESV